MTYEMIDHSNKQIKKQRRPARLHLHLHRPAPLESIAAADDESEVVCSQLRVRSGCVSVGVAGGGEDRAALDAGLQALLFERQALQFGEVVTVC